VGWLGTLYLILGSYLLGRRIACGWLVNIAGQVCWMIAGFQRGTWDLIAVNLAFTALAFYNYFVWRKAGSRLRPILR
jgi:hypothetical protein